MNGGQILAKKIGEALNLKDGLGLEFYNFPGVDIRGFAKDFKIAMDKVVDKNLQDELVAEANKSFQLQIDIFSGIGK